MCEAGEGTLLESLKLKGADIPPQSEQQQEEEGESDDVVEVDLETKVKDLSAEQAVQAAQINSLSEDMDNLKDSVFKGGEGIVKLTVSVSSLFTAFQQLAVHAGFKLPMATLKGLNRPEAGDSTAAVVASGTTRGALQTSAVAPSLARRPLFGQIPGFVQAQGATSGAQRSRAGDTGPAAGASSSAADQVGAAACVTTAAADQPGASVCAPPAGAGQLGAYAGAPPPGAVQPGSSAGALPAGARLPGAAAVVSQPAAGQPGAGVFAPQAGGVQPGASAHVAPAGPSGHALHRPNLLFHGSGHPTASVHLPLSSHGPGVQEPPAFLFAAEALDTGSILPGHTSSAPRGTLLNMPSQQVLPSPAASSSFMPSTQVGEEEEAASKGFTGVTKKEG
ncbi:unnamed protein product [Closterium sp. Naga37s-1]|nr:unnamed protein product [Closterium sp. Naga37s-1]